MKPVVTNSEPGRSAFAQPPKGEDLIDQAAAGQCEVRSETEHPCGRPTAVTIMGIQFCEQCAREQEAYFAVGEYTQATRGGVRMTHAARWQRPAFPARLLRSLRETVATGGKISSF